MGLRSPAVFLSSSSHALTLALLLVFLSIPNIAIIFRDLGVCENDPPSTQASASWPPYCQSIIYPTTVMMTPGVIIIHICSAFKIKFMWLTAWLPQLPAWWFLYLQCISYSTPSVLSTNDALVFLSISSLFSSSLSLPQLNSHILHHFIQYCS